jgi:hypothetical protein
MSALHGVADRTLERPLDAERENRHAVARVAPAHEVTDERAVGLA